MRWFQRPEVPESALEFLPWTLMGAGALVITGALLFSKLIVPKNPELDVLGALLWILGLTAAHIGTVWLVLTVSLDLGFSALFLGACWLSISGIVLRDDGHGQHDTNNKRENTVGRKPIRPEGSKDDRRRRSDG